MHTHCKPASLCAHHQPEQLPEMFKAKGIDAIVLTNHCYPTHCKTLADSYEEQAQVYVDTYHRCKTSGDAVGINMMLH